MSEGGNLGERGTGGFVSKAAVVSGLTLISRLTGLVRDAVLAAVFGLGSVADAFFVAFLIPNLFRRLFGEGALTAAFIPRYSQLLAQDRELARRFATFCTLALAVLLSVMVLIGEGILWWLSGHADGERAQLTVKLAMIMLPYMPLVCGVAFLGAVLQVHGRFGPPAAAPVLLNLVVITAAVLQGMSPDGEWVSSGEDVRRVARRVAGAVVFAGGLQLIWQVLALRPVVRPLLGMKDVGPPARQMMRAMIPMLIGLGVFQLNTLLDTLIAYLGSPPNAGVGGTAQAMTSAADLAAESARGPLGTSLPFPMQTGDVAALQWAQRLYQFPLGVFGIAIATAIFPALARAANHKSEFDETLRRGLRLAVFIGLPSSVGLMLVGLPLSRLVYERAAFDLGDAQRVAAILTGYAASVWAYSLTQTVTRAFYALDDAKTPLRVSLGMVACNLTLNLILVWPLGAAGLAWSTAFCAAGQSLILIHILHRRGRVIVDAEVRRSWQTSGLATIAMGLAVAGLILFLKPGEHGRGYSAATLAGTTLLGCVVFFGIAKARGMAELHWLLRRGT